MNGPADFGTPISLPLVLSGKLADVFSHQNTLGESIAWAVPCISGRARRLPGNLFGALVATSEEPRKVYFVARKSGRPFHRTIELDELIVGHEPKFLSENLILSPSGGKGAKYLFIFPRPHARRVEQIVEYLRERLKERPAEAEALASSIEA